MSFDTQTCSPSVDQARAGRADFQARIPRHLVASKTNDAGRVILLRPKFTSCWTRWLQRLLPKPYFRVKLDEVGTVIWLLADGRRNVGEILSEVRIRCGAAAEPVEERAGRFLVELEAGRFIRLEEPSESH